jgi:hypothetical protein
MVDNESNWIIDICDEIIFMLNNNQFNYTNNTKYNSLIVKLFKDYINFIDSYNNQEENPERFFGNYTQEELSALEIFKALLRDSRELIDTDVNNPDNIALLEKYFNQIALNLDKTTRVQAVQTFNPTHLPMTSITTHENNNNKKIIKANEKWLNDLTLISQQQKRIEFEQNFLYHKNIDTKNRIVKNHYRIFNLLVNQDLIIWKDQNNRLYHRQKAFEKEQKITKNEIADITGFYISVYDSTKDVQVIDADYIIISLLPTVRKNIFCPFSNNELLFICNNLYDKNTFEYTKLLEKRLVPLRINQLEKEINPIRIQPYYFQISNQIINKEHELQYLRNSLVAKDESFIEKLLKLIFQNNDEFYFFISWLSNYFWTLNKSNIALVLIGDSETTDILVDYIIKPIFVKNKKYFSTINNETLKNSDDEKLLADKIFYHFDNLSGKTDSRRISKLLRNIVKPNYITPSQAWDNDEPYIYGEVLVTSEKENPYSYLKKIFTSCSVLRVKSMDTILDSLNIEYSQFDKNIADDLNNFVNKLVQYSQYNKFPEVLNTDEKIFLHTMKNGVLITPKIDREIDTFIENILSKYTSAFKLIKEYDEEMYEELLSNFDEDMIVQPLLNTYFNILNGDMLIPDNAEFIKILQTKAEMFKEVLNDKSKSNGKKRYKIFR